MQNPSTHHTLKARPEHGLQSDSLHSRDGSGLPLKALLGTAALTTLAACGGGGGGDVAETMASADAGDSKRALQSAPGTAAAGAAATAMTSNEASRLLSQASFGGDRSDIERAQQLGREGWINDQFNKGRSMGHVAWLRAQGLDKPSDNFSRNNLDYTVWRKFLSSQDGLRQRMVWALSQILVVSVESVGGYWPAFAVAYYLDILERRAFDNYRDLLQDVSLSPAMGRYLSIRRSRKEDGKGRRPDENYAREIMQLFTIGLYRLKEDGTLELDKDGKTIPSYTEDDVAGLARVFTGYEYWNDADSAPNPDAHIRPMVNESKYFETGAKTFLGTTIAAGTGDRASLRTALDTLFKHPNVGPFIGKQLIQRFVTSNPSPQYVQRVAQKFANNGSGVRGDLKAVLQAILTDPEATDMQAAQSNASFGKLREPVLRFAQWARACKVGSASGQWRVPNLSSPVDRLGQNPLRSPSVFNFYRPGYIPPNSALSQQGKVAPELQITTETSVAGYINFMQGAISTRNGIINSDVKPNYAIWLTKADDAQALADEANTVLAAGQMSPQRVAVIVDALNKMPKNTDDQKLQRVHTALLLTLVAPEYLVQK